jgi:hypothetical protein
MHMFAAPGAYILMLSWPRPFTMTGRQGCGAALKTTLSRGRLKCKKGRMMRSPLGWIQPDEDITILDITTPSIEEQGPITRSRAQQLRRQVNLFLCSSANDLENRLLPNDLIVIRNKGVDHGGHVGHQEGAGEPRKHAQQGGGPSQFRV